MSTLFISVDLAPGKWDFAMLKGFLEVFDTVRWNTTVRSQPVP